ncbi:hypothetical protein [Dyadobacter pollutisoli]|jgi:hypothetical protein|uniref:Uncharacterized protein n=1 Tax=Dyadobacter pollutisoli TaxID=2910158 RepID=A0A9E8N7R5_9BACT|nr:hypothetical protein [Dyadobacter pollutisoli]WAC11455.1 hypothetical protein ON006_27455 [Dyadobacter pollutisoli]
MENTKYKENWNDADFEKMGWHDCKIYSILSDDSNFRLILDIDYIFEWITDSTSEYYKFLLSPSTLVFHNVWDLKIDLETDGEIEISDIHRENPRKPKNEEYIDKKTEWDWLIETQSGIISFRSVGFDQYSRDTPVLSEFQSLGLSSRMEMLKLYKIPDLNLKEPEFKRVRPARQDELPRQ